MCHCERNEQNQTNTLLNKPAQTFPAKKFRKTRQGNYLFPSPLANLPYPLSFYQLPAHFILARSTLPNMRDTRTIIQHQMDISVHYAFLENKSSR